MPIGRREATRPMYLQLKQAIMTEIAVGHYQPHQRLASERELCQRHSMSRMTVRQALTELVREGVLYTRTGKGTFVAAPPAARPPDSGWSFSQQMRARGGTATSRVLDATVIAAPPPVAALLQVAHQAELIMLVRVRLADGVPMALETVFLPFAAFPDLLRHDFSRESLHDVLAQVYRLTLAQVEQPIEASLADAREAEALGLSWPSAVLKLQRVLKRPDGLPVALALSSYRGDYYRLLGEGSGV